MKMEEQVMTLKGRFAAPLVVRLLAHKAKSASGDDEDQVADCCQAAKATMHGALVAAASSGGINGVVQYFTTDFTWGCVQGHYYCDCFDHRKELYCVGTACVGLESLNFYRSISPPSAHFDLVIIELVATTCPSVTRSEKLWLSEEEERNSTYELSRGWVLDNTYYHVLVGIVDSDLKLHICDYDARMPYLLSDNDSATKITAMRVSPWLGDSASTKLETHVVWNGTKLALSQWVDFDGQHLQGSASSCDTVAALGGVYGAHASPSKSSGMRSHPSSTSMTTDMSLSLNSPYLSSPGRTSTELHHLLHTALPTVFISGTYMGTNPCPGVGIARALRTGLSHTGAQLIAVGDAEFSDPAFDAYWPVEELGTAGHLSGHTKTQKQWEAVSEVLLGQMGDDNGKVLFIPGCDLDTDLASQAKSALLMSLGHRENAPGDQFGSAKTAKSEDLCINSQWSAQQKQALGASLLCPTAGVVALTEKPEIMAATRGPLSAFFKAPEHSHLTHDLPGADSDERVSLMEIRTFADRIGYPVLVKGTKQGALICHSWFQLRAALIVQKSVQGGFVQKCAQGFEKCLAFAAFEGHLLGCCMMTKGSVTAQGKVWSGDIEPVPEDLVAALEQFALLTDWTGGGEIEFIEEMLPSSALSFEGLHQPRGPPPFMPRSSVPHEHPLATRDAHARLQEQLPGRWVVDFNPRFPAWIFASAYSGCNLPALLVNAALHGTAGETITSTGSDSEAGPMRRWHDSSLSSDPSTPSCTGDSVSTTAELPIPLRVSFVRSLIEVPVVHTQHYRHLPRPIGTSVAADKAKSSVPKSLGVFAYDVLPELCHQALLQDGLYSGKPPLHHLVGDLQRLTESAAALLSSNSVECTPRYVLCTTTFRDTLTRLNDLFAFAALSAGVSVQLCLSIKTQPQTALLRAAARAGYFAECIDLAEVYHSVFNGEFAFDKVVLTGPGKWWDTKTTAAREAEMAHWAQDHPTDATTKYHAVFADSLSDLETIVQRLLDPSDMLDTHVVGIRWTPLWSTTSRFGLNSKDVKIVRRAAELVRRLPDTYSLGMHFHHAASVLGGKTWLALAQAFSLFCSEFSVLCGRPLATVDFGGGFEPYFLERVETQEQLTQLFTCVRQTCGETNRQQTPLAPPLSVQFELGKCVSEPAGGILTRILAIREREDPHDDEQDGETDSTSEPAKAVIVDTTIADLSTPNSHPVFWIKSDRDQEDHPIYKCVPLRSGRVEIWGRTCMEWDKVHGLFELPAEAAVGDFLLIAGCGAYDMSMQYGFGDGVERTDNVLLV